MITDIWIYDDIWINMANNMDLQWISKSMMR